MQMKQCRVMQRHRVAPKTAPSVHPIKTNARASTYNQIHNQIKCSSIDPESTNDIPTESGTPDNWPSSTDAMKLPNQAETIFGGIDRGADVFGRVAVADVEAKSTSSDLDYLSELLAIQQSDGPKKLGFFGTRNMGVTHQKLVEILAYAMVATGNHIYTSGATGTNAAVIKGALRANAPDLLTVILPQSRSQQPGDSQDLLSQVANVVEMPENDSLSLLEASRICNNTIITRVQQVICFAFHDSRLLLKTCNDAKEAKKIVTLFYLD